MNKKILLTLLLTATLGVAAQTKKEDTIHPVGKDGDGDQWYLDTSLVVTPKPPSDWVRIMPIYTTTKGRTLVFFFNVDCSDSTYQMTRAFSMDDAGRKLWERTVTSRWAKFVGYSGNAARIVCAAERRPTSNRFDGE
jgi:hypothetical protein